MQQILEFSKAVGGMPVMALGTLIILSAFGLAAFAISAVVKFAKARRDGD
jgi:hypothetical protein